MSSKLRGMIDWGGSGDKEGHRDYYVEWLCQTTRVTDGPVTVRNTPGLPAIGSTWAYGTESDPEAFCEADWQITPVVTNEPGEFWKVKQNYTTKPYSVEDTNNPLQHPLLAAPKISGSFVKYTKEAGFDRFGRVVKNTAHEPFRGKLVELDANRHQVVIERNLALLDLYTWSLLVDTVNSFPLWGLPARCIKLSNVSWSKQFYALVQVFYPVKFEFDINFIGFDTYLPNFGTSCLRGWSPGSIYNATPQDPLEPVGINGDGSTVYAYQDPAYFEAYKTKEGENRTVPLDLFGKPKHLSIFETVDFFKFEGYFDGNFGLLPIPFSLA